MAPACAGSPPVGATSIPSGRPTARGSPSCGRSRPAGASSSCRRRVQERRLPQAPPAGRPSWTRNGKSILIPSAADLVQVDAQTGRIQKYFGLTLDIQTTQNATVSPNDLMVAYLGPRLSGPRTAARAVPGTRSTTRASRRPPAAADRQRHRRRRLVAGREDAGLRAPRPREAQDCLVRSDEDDRHRSTRRSRRFASRVAAALSLTPAGDRSSDDSEDPLHARLALVGRQGA